MFIQYPVTKRIKSKRSEQSNNFCYFIYTTTCTVPNHRKAYLTAIYSRDPYASPLSEVLSASTVSIMLHSCEFVYVFYAHIPCHCLSSTFIKIMHVNMAPCDHETLF